MESAYKAAKIMSPAPSKRRQQRDADQNNQITLTIESLSGSGSGIGRARGQTVFVPFTIPGERVRARITGKRDGVTQAEGLELIEASADRVYPVCEGYLTASCVRCGWQHIDYPAQLLLKHDLLADQLERLGQIKNPNILPLVPAVEQWNYLSQVVWQVTGGAYLKLPGRAGAPVRHRACALIHPDILNLFDSLDFGEGGLTGISRLRIQRGSDGAMMIVLNAETEDAPELELDMDASINLTLPDNEPVNLIGSSFSQYEIGAVSVRATVGAFFRPNVSMIAPLVNAVLALLDLKGGERVLDLYAGVGVFSAFIAPHVSALTLVESYPPAVTDADVNLEGFSHVDIIEGGVEAVLPELEGQYDAAVVDPARGLNDAVIAGINDLGVHKLVYVSDDAAELARDARILAKTGWKLQESRPIDTMPQTPFFDTAALFHKSE